MEGYIKRWEQLQRSPQGYNPLPWNFGDDGRYLYVLNAGAQTVSVIDCSSDTVVTTITLASGKDFGSVHYRPNTKQLICMSNTWMDIIDADTESATFNTVISSVSFATGVTASIASYLPFPFDYLSSGGSSVEIPDSLSGKVGVTPTRDGRYSAYYRLGGHSNTYNTHFHHLSNEVSCNRIQYRVTRNNRMSSVNYGFNVTTRSNWYNDLNGLDFPVTKFGNFFIAITAPSAYMIETDNCISSILFFLNTLGHTFYGYGVFCPNAPNRYFVAYNSGSNLISVIQLDYTNKALVDLGDVLKTGLGTAENGTRCMLHNPYNGKLYAQGNSSLNVTGVDKVHVLDPTAASIANLQVGTITVGEMKSASTAARYAQNTMTLNRLQCWEYPQIRM